MILASQNIITGQDASSPLLLATFTPSISGEYFASVNLSLLAGTGVYRFITTRQIGGTGTIYQSGTSAIGVSAGVTTLTISTIPTPLLAGDILKVYVQGLAGDTAIDGVIEIFRSDVLTDSDLTPLAKTTHLQEVENKIDAIDITVNTIPTNPLLDTAYTAPDNAGIAAIKAKTNLIPANPAVADEYDAALAAIQADLDNPNQYKADVSGLATQASVNAIPTTPLLAANYVAPNNSGIASILEDTGTTIPATLAGLATSAEVGAITMLDEIVVGTYTMQDILKILAAKMVGKATGGGTATITYLGLDDTSNVIVETVDSNGNRSAVTLTV